MIAASEVFSLSMSKKKALRRHSNGAWVYASRTRQNSSKERSSRFKFTGVSGVCTKLSVDKIPALTKTTFQATKTGKLTIKTTDISTIYDNTIDALSKENVLVGDVITIDKMSGKITELIGLHGREIMMLWALMYVLFSQ